VLRRATSVSGRLVAWQTYGDVTELPIENVRRGERSAWSQVILPDSRRGENNVKAVVLG
jgi:hypothetical protein